MTGVCVVKVQAQTLGLRFTLRMNRDVESRRADLVRHFTKVDDVVEAVRKFVAEYEGAIGRGDPSAGAPGRDSTVTPPS